MLAAISWGLTWIPLRFLHDDGFDALFIVVCTHFLLFLVFVFHGCRRVILENIRAMVGIAIAGGLAILCFSIALVYGEVVRVMVLFYLLPVWGVIGGHLFLREKVDLIRGLSVVFAVLGAFLILGGFNLLKSPPGWVDFVALLSGLCFAVNNLLFRGVSQVPLAPKLWMMFSGCVVIGSLLIFSLSSSVTMPSETSSWGWLMAYGLVWLLFGNIGSQWAVVRMEAGRSSVILILELVAAVCSAMLLVGERLSPIEWLGCILVVGAALAEGLRSDHECDGLEAN